MSLPKEIDKLLDELSDEIKCAKKYKDGGSPINHEERINEIKDAIRHLTLNGERAEGIWTSLPDMYVPVTTF